MSRPRPDQPRVRDNDWTVLTPAPLGRWAPRLSVSVVIPAHAPRGLGHVLAALSVQTYPAHLMEVVVVDDGSRPAVELPEVRPERTRLVRVGAGWGRAAACQWGADRSDGEVIHWLDADMVAHPDEVEAQMRWHHLVDHAVVMGHKLFADAAALDHLVPARLAEALASGADLDRLVRGSLSPHEWVERILAATADLAAAGPRAMRVHAGASASVARELFTAAGGMPVDLVLAEDIVLGYRLREVGAVFVPDRQARAVHLGRSTVMRDAEAVNRYNRPFVADKVPEFRGHRVLVPRSYEVPYLEVVLPVGDAAVEAVCTVVDGLLADSVPDLVVTLVADWGRLGEERRAVLDEDLLDLRLVRATYASEPRVRLCGAPAERCEATFRLTLPGPDAVPVGRALQDLLLRMEREHLGLVRVDLGAGAEARCARSAAVARARRVRRDGEPLDGALAAVSGRVRLTAGEAGFVAQADAPKIRRAPGVAPWRAQDAPQSP